MNRFQSFCGFVLCLTLVDAIMVAAPRVLLWIAVVLLAFAWPFPIWRRPSR